MIVSMRLSSTLAWLVDSAGGAVQPDDFLATLGARLVDDGLPLAGGALTLAAPHPIITRRAWLWRAETGVVMEALAFGAGTIPGAREDDLGREWLAGLGTGVVHDYTVGPEREDAQSENPKLNWVPVRPLVEHETNTLNHVARFAAAPLAALAARSALSALLQAYLGQRSAAQVLAGRSRREVGETIRAVLLYSDLRDFAALSEETDAEQVVAALNASFDRIAGAVHVFGGEVLKFIGDGVLAIFPVGERSASEACEAALRAIGAARAGMTQLNQVRTTQGMPELQFGMALHLGDMVWGNVGTADRLDFTAIGPAVNLVSRLEGLCRPLGRSVLISGTVAAEISTPLVRLGEHQLRGIARSCAVFGLPDG